MWIQHSSGAVFIGSVLDDGSCELACVAPEELRPRHNTAPDTIAVMTTNRMQAGGIVVLVLLVVGAVVLALRPGTTEVVVDNSPPVEPPADGTAVIAALRAPGGLSLFGMQIIDPTHTIEVVFLTGPGCSALLASGDQWPTPHPECASDVDVAGEVGSLGVTATGKSLVGVTFTLSGRCYDVLERGMTWPPDLPECLR